MRFIRHPTTDWSQTRFEPGEVEDAARRAAHARQAQRLDRAAILIRNREFDILRRELRNRKSASSQHLEGLTIASTLPPPPLRAASRLHTLHKIDAIERQIQSEHKRQLSSTIPDGLIVHSNPPLVDFAASALHPGTSQLGSPRPPEWPPQHMQAPPAQPLSGREPILPNLPAVIELASFDFAEGRDAQAESQLLAALQTEADHFARQHIFQALLDFYWATGQSDKLQSRALDYVRDYGQTPLPRPELGPQQGANPKTA
ncbi:MAG: hypothetical protein ACP5F9_08755, partial [Thiomonas sp.]